MSNPSSHPSSHPSGHASGQPSGHASGAPQGPPCNIGPRIAIRGNITGEEDLVIEGRVEGSIALSGHLGISQAAVIEADLEVDSVDIHGQLDGDIIAVTTITLHEGCRVAGNLRAPRIAITDGAQFKGTVEMDVPLPASVTRQQRR
nr:polymer-forming cytoskeletal protein [Nannocystis sp.]